MSLTARTTEPTRSIHEVNGINICLFHWRRSATKKTLLLLHATGFHARCWDQVVNTLKFDGSIIAVDLRGHGRSQKKSPYDWNTFGDDIVQLLDHLDLKGVSIAGHSMGGRCAVYAAANRPSRVEDLVLIDPVILHPEMYQETDSVFSYENAEDHPVARRKGSFDSPESMFDRFKNRSPYSLWQADVLRDYCNYGLLKQETDYVLACPPLVEARIYTESAKSPAMDLLPLVRQPTVVLRAKERVGPREGLDFSLSPTWPMLADALPNATDVYLPRLTHFIPMQDPQLVADTIDSLCTTNAS